MMQRTARKKLPPVKKVGEPKMKLTEAKSKAEEGFRMQEEDEDEESE